MDEKERVSLEAVLTTTGQVLSRWQAAGFLPSLDKFGIGDGMHGLNMRLPRNLNVAEQTALIVRPAGERVALERSTFPATTYQPVRYIVGELGR